MTNVWSGNDHIQTIHCGQPSMLWDSPVVRDTVIGSSHVWDVCDVDYQWISKPGNKTVAPPWLDIYFVHIMLNFGPENPVDKSILVRNNDLAPSRWQTFSRTHGDQALRHVKKIMDEVRERKTILFLGMPQSLQTFWKTVSDQWCYSTFKEPKELWQGYVFSKSTVCFIWTFVTVDEIYGYPIFKWIGVIE